MKDRWYFTSPRRQPPLPDWGDHWIRSLSPWHRDAFPDDLKPQAPEQGKRKKGWMLLDYWENAIAFVPDGTRVKLK